MAQPTPDTARPTLRDLLARCDFARLEPQKLDRLVAEADGSRAEGPRQATSSNEDPHG